MTAPIFIGDEWTAVGYRLAGARALTPDAERSDAGIIEAFDQALRDAPPLLLITAQFAARLDPARLERARKRGHPPVAVVGDAAHTTQPESPVGVIRKRMGVAE